MSGRAPATRARRRSGVAGLLLFVAAWPTTPAVAAESVAAAEAALASAPAAAAVTIEAPFERIIARVLVNTVNHGDVPVLRDAKGNFLVAAAEFARWGLTVAAPPTVAADGEPHVALAGVPGLEVRFDAKAVTLHLNVAATALAGTSIDLRPQRRAGVIQPADTSVFLNYGINASGDESFSARRYQAAAELGARHGNWLLYGSADYQWGDESSRALTRLLTNAQYEDRPNLRRLTVGDFFTAAFDLSTSVPMGGLSLTKDYSMDPYFVQYPTAAFRTEVAFPSTVQVRVDGNLVDQRQVQPGTVDIRNITGVTGAQNVSVVIRDPFGREQVLQQPFFFATNVGLAEGLHEYSYNVGLLRGGYGIESNDYGDPALAAFHRYAFTNRLTLGLRGQATRDLYNVGPFGTYQLPRLGIFAAGVSVGGRDGSTGYAASAAYSYTGQNFAFNLGARHFSRDFGQLADLTSSYRQRSAQYASASVFAPAVGTLALAYSGFDTYDGTQSKIVNLSYTLGTLGGRGLVSASYLRTLEPATGWTALLSFRYYLDRLTSTVAALGAGRDSNTQSLSLQRSIPQGQGIGYDVTAGRVGGDAGSGAFGRGFVQFNASHAEVGAEYARSSRDGAPGYSRAFVAGSIGAVGGSVFAARPVLDSFALIRIPELADVPVYANGWYAGRTNAAGEAVATNLSAYYDNFISFGVGDLPMDYVFASSQTVISPPRRSGTLVAFEVRRMRAVIGVLVGRKNGTTAPLEFRELTLTRGAEVIKGFTARRGEFYVEGVEPGEYQLQLNNGAPCTARLRVPDDAGAMTDVGTLTCVPAGN
jgi:outer membrane usher protein FimD/PapC